MSSGHDRAGLRVPHDRRSVRLPGYDYAQPGAYFVTICTRNSEPLLGDVLSGRVQLSTIGRQVRRCWLDIPRHFPHAELDAFVIMPDHVHGIIRIVRRATNVGDGIDDVGARHALPLQKPAPIRSQSPTARFGHPPPRALSAIVGAFKAAAARAINADRGCPGAPVWQRNYYEHIMRTEDTLRKIRRYIETNPERWGKS